MATIASLFESQDEATKALDALVRTEFEDLDYRVYDGSGAETATSARVIGLPVAEPNVGGEATAGILSSAGTELDDEELSDYFMDAVERGNAVLVVADVDDDRADALESFFREYGGRTSEDD
ncbi:MAG TPA: hypothetical protein VE553_09840 [Candidatus Binatia bacterium]|nr:hypothetical protein [Candidatus Binatia bacterium]